MPHWEPPGHTLPLSPVRSSFHQYQRPHRPPRSMGWPDHNSSTQILYWQGCYGHGGPGVPLPSYTADETPVPSVLDDPGELVGVDAGPADERSVDVGLRHQLGDVRGLDRTPVLDAQRRGRGGIGQLGDVAADGRAHGL